MENQKENGEEDKWRCKNTQENAQKKKKKKERPIGRFQTRAATLEYAPTVNDKKLVERSG